MAESREKSKSPPAFIAAQKIVEYFDTTGTIGLLATEEIIAEVYSRSQIMEAKNLPSESREKSSKEYTCGNCGFIGNAHEHEVHAAIRHISCDAPDCEACEMKKNLELEADVE